MQMFQAFTGNPNTIKVNDYASEKPSFILQLEEDLKFYDIYFNKNNSESY